MNPASVMPTTLNSTPLPPEAESLGAQRHRSSIPMADPANVPHHQGQGQDTWLYPSERMFYTAMKRKVRALCAVGACAHATRER